MKRDMPDLVQRGQMYFADLNPIVGSEQGGFRPVLVIQNDVGNLFSPTIIVAPITSEIKKIRQPTHIGIPPFFGLPEQSMAMLEQVRTIDKSRLEEYIGCLDDDVMDYIDEALGISVGLNSLMSAKKQRHKKSRKKSAEATGELLLTLCPVCLNQFINSRNHIVRRANRTQTKEPCVYCNVRDGYDYRIIHKKKRLGDDRY